MLDTLDNIIHLDELIALESLRVEEYDIDEDFEHITLTTEDDTVNDDDD